MEKMDMIKNMLKLSTEYGSIHKLLNMGQYSLEDKIGELSDFLWDLDESSPIESLDMLLSKIEDVLDVIAVCNQFCDKTDSILLEIYDIIFEYYIPKGYYDNSELNE